MNRNRKQIKGLALAAAVLSIGVALFVLPSRVSAEDDRSDREEQMQAPVQPVYEGEKTWKFEHDNLVFFNPSPNQGGVRYMVWKDYTWVVTQNQITVIDQRPYGTQLQGQRNLMTNDGPQDDKDLMNDLKRQAGDIRKSRDPNSDSLPISIGIGLDFFQGGHNHHDGHRGGHR